MNSLDSVNERLILTAVDELHEDLSELVCTRRELRIIGYVLSASDLKHIQVGQNRGSIEHDIEDALSWASPVRFGEMHLHGIRSIRDQVSQNVREGHVALILVDSLRSRIRIESDGICRCGYIATIEVFVGHKVANRRTARVDGEVGRRPGSGSHWIAASGWNDLDGVDGGVEIRNRRCSGEGLNLDDAVLVRGGIELLRDGSLRGAGGGKDVEVGQDLFAVDGDIEIALACSGVGPFHKVQPNVIADSGQKWSMPPLPSAPCCIPRVAPDS